jgi:hypothetical protein
MAHPAKLSIERPEKLSRGILILRLLLGWAYIGIPHGLCLFFYGIGVCFAAIYAWIVVLFTGKYPEGVFKFIEGYFRWQWRVNSYWMFMTDTYPPFSTDAEA